MKKLNFTGFRKLFIAMFIILYVQGQDTNAQYFGRNKVNYKNLDFNVLHTEHFDIYFYPQEKGGVQYAAEMAERWYARHHLVFGDTLKGKQPLILYSSFPQFAQTNVTEGEIGQGTGGFTEPLLRRIALPFAGPLKETDHVIGHELVHAFQYDLTSRKSRASDNPNMPALERLPLWFVEGMAEYFSLGPNDPFTAMWMREAALTKLPDISDLDNPKYFPYRYGQSLLAYVGSKWGDKIIGRLLRTAGFYGNINKAIDSVLLITPDSLSKEWHAAIHNQYDSLVRMTSKPTDYGRALITGKPESNEFNISPVLSPDGKNLVFFSSKNLFSIDIFLADAETGKIKKTILNTAVNTHLQGLEFINSAGAWDSKGTRFLFSAVVKGTPTLSILNVENGKIEKEYSFPNLGEIFDPTWSPDDKYIVFSGLGDGLSNLFLYDTSTDSLHNLTNDPYAELQPTWSPDGKSIIFVTDRFSTKLPNLDYGNYQLAIMDFQTRAIHRLPCFENAKNINPQWTSDGKGIYFLSDRNGITNLYTLNLESKIVTQMTNLYSGISGITNISPAVSSARNADKIVFSVYEKNNYNIYSIDSAGVLEGKKAFTEFPKYDPGVLPPLNRTSDFVLNNINNPNLGIPTDSTFKITDYKPSFSLIGAAQPSIVAGADRFGAYFGGGIALYWSDMLGNRNLVTGLQLQSLGTFRFTDISAIVGYYNTGHRWNYGAVIQQMPYTITDYTAGYETINNELAYVEQQILYRQTDREISGVAAYPFSENTRVEFSGGYSNITFLSEVQTTAVSVNTGNILQDNTQDFPTGSALNLGHASAAYVFDNSFFGATSPLLGQRYRLEVSPTVGTLTWVDLLADYRRYFMPIRPITLAGRIIHYGRYGKSSEDFRLNPLFLGYPGLVRGYDNGSFSTDEIVTDTTAYGSLFNRLTGSKLIIANFELRFPLFGIFGLGSGYYGYLPIETGVFYDAGIAWSNHQKISLTGSQRPVRSYGITIRMNLFGYAIGEVDYVHPLDRPDKKWLWQFNFVEGF